MRFKSMSGVQDACDRLARRLVVLLSRDEMRDLIELVDANRINQDLELSLEEALADAVAASAPDAPR